MCSLARRSSGKLGVEWLDEPGNSCSLVLMDRTMPVMDGVKATRLIKKRHPSLTVVGLTGDAQSEDINDLKKAGVEHIIVKPVFKEQLLRVVKAFIGMCRPQCSAAGRHHCAVARRCSCAHL